MKPTRSAHVAEQSPSVSWAREVVQRQADDVVLLAGLFKPNAPGNFDFSPSGIGDRQLLKSRGVYLGERILLGITPLHLYAIELVAGGRLQCVVGRWQREDLVPTTVLAQRGRTEIHDPHWPAVLVTRRRGRPLAELQVVDRDRETGRLLDLLLSGRSIVDHRPEAGH